MYILNFLCIFSRFGNDAFYVDRPHVIKLDPPANQINFSCVQLKTFRAFESKRFLCSKPTISYVRVKGCLVFESKDFACSNQTTKSLLVFESRDIVCSNQKISLCSNQEMSCVRIKTSLVFQSRHSLGPTEDMWWFPRRTCAGGRYGTRWSGT